MKTARMLVGGAVATFLIAMGALALARGPSGASLPTPAVSIGEVQETPSTPLPTPSPSNTPGVDISGPCDEAEHANDPRCAGVQVPATGVQVGGVDISGPCDEAEHANDPRCTNPGAEDDRSGPGDGGADDRSGPSGDDEDNSGPSENSGPGNASDDD